MYQFMGRRNQIKCSFVLKVIEAWNVYNMILMYITLFTNETCAYRLIWFFGVTVDNGGSQKTERTGNTWRIHSHKRGVLKYYDIVEIIYIINVAKIKIYRSLDNI